MAKIGLIFNGVWSHYALATAPKYRDLYRLLYIHDLDAAAVQDLAALVIPFQSNQAVLAEKQAVIYDFLAAGNKVFVEGDSSATWLDAQWEDRPVNNYWWVTDPARPPVAHTDYGHPVYRGLTPRQACWHTHGVYTRVPDAAEIIQTNDAGDVITCKPTRTAAPCWPPPSTPSWNTACSKSPTSTTTWTSSRTGLAANGRRPAA